MVNITICGTRDWSPSTSGSLYSLKDTLFLRCLSTGELKYYRNGAEFTVNVLKFCTFLFSNKMLYFRDEILLILIRIANREDPDQTASEEAV